MPKHVALIFPGRRYGPELPLLRYPAQGMLQVGADVHVIDYPDFLIADDAPTEQQLEQALEPISRTVADRIAGATRVTLLAKSLGTRVIARLAPGLLPAEVDPVWLTPIFVDSTTAEAAGSRTWRSLYVYGSADPLCDEAVLRDVVAATGGTVLVIDEGDHALEVGGDVSASVDALVRVTTAVLDLASMPSGRVK